MGKNFKFSKRNFKKRNDKLGSNRNQENKSDTHSSNERNNLTEDQVGITECLNHGSGFTGVLKARFSDFQVNEVDLNGTVLQLDDIHIPEPIDDDLSTEELKTSKDELSSVVSDDIWKQVEELITGKANQKISDVEIDVTNMDKDTRTKIHKVMKNVYETRIVSSTVAVGDKKFIKITKAKNNNRRDDRIKWTFPGEYVHFLVYKENMSTNEVAMTIANHLRMNSSKVTYCGTKDKRAKTTQKFCVKRRLPRHIVQSIKSLPSVQIGNFQFSDVPLKLGDCKGNRFRIALRLVTGDDDQIDKIMNNVKENGFINYYGLQRFGNSAAIPTHEIGIALLRCDFKLACELIMKPRIGDKFFMKPIREKWWKDRNSSEAFSMIRSNYSIEKKLLYGLSKYGESNYATALRNIPRNTLLLYPHAYQSFIFNRIASRRIKEFGLKIIPGDLVYRNRNEEDPIELPEDVNEVVKTEDIESDAEDEIEMEVDDTTSESVSLFKRKVKPLTKEDIESGDYTMFDVVLPLPGYDITYPNNEVGHWYEEYLEENGLSSEKLKHRVKFYAMPGQYRKLLIKPLNMTWQFKQYDSPESNLIVSDWDKLSGQSHTEDSSGGKFKALLIDFQLPACAYATMLLREIFKFDTSAASQSQLNKSEMEKHENVEDFQNNKQQTFSLKSCPPFASLSTEKRKDDSVSVDVDDATDIVDAKRQKICDNPQGV